MNDTNSRLWPTRYGLAVATPEGNHAARSLQHYGEWMEQELDLLSGWLQEGQTVLEFGGDYGAHALCMAQAVGSDGAVHVVEPVRLAFQLLCANVALNGLRNVHATSTWLGARHGSIAAAQVTGRLVQQAEPGEVFSITSVDALGLPHLHLLKCNVAGALRDMVAGASETLRSHRPTIYARLGGVDMAEAEVRVLKEHGYRCWSHAPFLFSRDNHAAHAGNIFPGCVSQNVIAVPIEGRCDLPTDMEL